MPDRAPIIREVQGNENLEQVTYYLPTMIFPIITVSQVFRETLAAAFKDAPDDDKRERPLLIAVLPDIAKPLKEKIKYYGDIVIGVPTQCFVRTFVFI